MHAEILPELYLHGLAQGNFELALRGLLGAGAPLSATSIARLKAGWQAEYEDWKRRALDDVEAVYLWADGVYVKAGLEKEKAAILVVIAGLRDGRKVVLAVESGYRESTESLGDAAARSQAARLSAATAGDRRRPSRHLGRARRGLPHGGGATVLESSHPQRARQAPAAVAGGGEAPADEAPVRGDPRGGRARQAGVPDVVHETWRRRRRAARSIGTGSACSRSTTSGALEALAHDQSGRVALQAVRLRTTAAKRYKKVENATAVIWKTWLIAERTFRRLDAPELLAEVANDVSNTNGVRQREKKVAA